MNPVSDQHFFDLAVKALAGQSSPQESAELDALLARLPEFKAEFDRLQADANLAREALPVLGATETGAGEFPAHLRGRLQTSVRQRFAHMGVGVPTRGKSRGEHSSRWGLGLAAGVVVIVLAIIPVFLKSPATRDVSRGRPSEGDLLELGSRKFTGTVTGSRTAPGAASALHLAVLETTLTNLNSRDERLALLQKTWDAMTLFQQAWGDTEINPLYSDDDLHQWERDWPDDASQGAIKVIYDRLGGRIRVHGRWRQKSFDQTFPAEPDPSGALNQVKAYIEKLKGQ